MGLPLSTQVLHTLELCALNPADTSWSACNYYLETAVCTYERSEDTIQAPTSILLSPSHVPLSLPEPKMHVSDASPSPSEAWLQVHSVVPGTAPQGWQPVQKTTTSRQYMASSSAPRSLPYTLQRLHHIKQ